MRIAPNIRQTLVGAVMAFDRRQEEKARSNPRAYHNTYALAQYLARVDDIMDDIANGASIDAAICAGFTPGPLRKACLKSLGLADSKAESSGSYKGLPVYRKASDR